MEKAPTFLSNWQPGGEINGCRIILALDLYSVPYNQMIHKWFFSAFSTRFSLIPIYFCVTADDECCSK